MQSGTKQTRVVTGNLGRKETGHPQHPAPVSPAPHAQPARGRQAKGSHARLPRRLPSMRLPTPTTLLHLSFSIRYFSFKKDKMLKINQSPGDYRRHSLCKGGLPPPPPCTTPLLHLSFIILHLSLKKRGPVRQAAPFYLSQ